ncbi:uncharacterized protein LOC119326673 [Triticum dicoccoides]|uniref:uncharacterized protein LOC119326673 n=1 Tax=Triticum dicoccoides TaxID=85692 RepID=UPI0018917651|nr:uncharacterized protein LOC119326673 [Triticum dicoccoides]XP_037456194.1 uncharacterized protein LOC119326673 [Triticum dicoccoides]
MSSGAADDRQIRVAPAILEHRGQFPALLLPQRRAPWETASPPIPDELLLDIFPRLPVAADLVRASAACVSFRRLIADRSFLRQYRKIHAPPLLGFLDFRQVFYPAEPPHPSASVAKAVALAADFTFSFLPAPSGDWAILDTCDGRVLLARRHYAELVVCDPLHWRHLLLPPIPEFDEWVRSVEKPRTFGLHLLLVGGGDWQASEEIFFRVIYATADQHKEAVFIFSSSTGQWRATPSTVRLDFSG